MLQNNFLVERIFDYTETGTLQDPALLALLAAYINRLIIDNFDALILLLYKVDVSEAKLKAMLKDNDTSDAGEIIARLVVDRLVQKIISRREHGRDNNIINEEDSW